MTHIRLCANNYIILNKRVAKALFHDVYRVILNGSSVTSTIENTAI